MKVKQTMKDVVVAIHNSRENGNRGVNEPDAKLNILMNLK